MANDLLAAALLSWLAGGAAALTGRVLAAARALLVLGALAGVAAALIALPGGTEAAALPTRLAGEAVTFRLRPEAAWLMGFGLVPAAFACALGSPATAGRGLWLFGAALEPDRRARRLRPRQRRRPADRLGGHELRRCGDAARRATAVGDRAFGSVHAGLARSRRGGAADCGRTARRAGREPVVRAFPRGRGGALWRGADRLSASSW